MRVGCPKEIKNHEYRVGLTPGAVREYVAHGHQVLIETGAGDAGLIAGLLLWAPRRDPRATAAQPAATNREDPR